jgi:SAM-dependent methyltransferase
MTRRSEVSDTCLIFHTRPARVKAKAAAEAEALSLLAGLDPRALTGGPLSDRRGTFWLALAADQIDAAEALLPRLGYTIAVDALEPIAEGAFSTRRADHLRWNRRPYQVIRLYEEDPDAARDLAPDRREFVLETVSGVRSVRGYRGDGGALSKRALPFYDARALVNLACGVNVSSLLDPFAGAGGIVVAAVEGGVRVFSGDIDPALRHGLAALGSAAVVADAARLPYADRVIGAIASEPPYEPSIMPGMVAALTEMRRVLLPGGRIALLCAEHQAGALRAEAARLGLDPHLDAAIDRKGMACILLVWARRVGG